MEKQRLICIHLHKRGRFRPDLSVTNFFGVQKKKEIRPDFIRGRAASKSNGIKTQKKTAAYRGDLGSTADAATTVDKYACGSKASVGSALMDFRKSLTPEWKKEEKNPKPFL